MSLSDQGIKDPSCGTQEAGSHWSTAWRYLETPKQCCALSGLQPCLTLEFPEELSNLAHELSFVPVSWLLLVSYVLGAGTTSVASVIL